MGRKERDVSVFELIFWPVLFFVALIQIGIKTAQLKLGEAFWVSIIYAAIFMGRAFVLAVYRR